MERWVKGDVRRWEHDLIVLLQHWRWIKIICMALSKASPAFHPLPVCAQGPQESPFQLWKSYEADLKHHFWKERTFWSDGYFWCTIGNASQEAMGHSLVNQD